MNHRYHLGIDLGTTHCALGVLSEEHPDQLDSFKILQFMDQGILDELPLLPSFLYHPTAQQLTAHTFSLPWDSSAPWIVGSHARICAEKLPQRIISSSKSWICDLEGQQHSNLPLAAADDIEKISSVQSASLLLNHLRQSWNHQHPQDLFEDQNLVLTVPASFDVVARELTLAAAKQAEISSVTLLEEPIAAFYAWIAENQQEWRQKVSVGDVILVCDIGGGTTDFSLITVSENAGELQLTRIAVGDHILLGGDNMDFAIAYFLQQKLKNQGKAIENWQFLSLVFGSRKAKESLLNDETLERVTVVVPSRGSQLLGGTLSVECTQQELQSLLLEGFFADCSIHDVPQGAPKLGLRTVGLPYARDSSILKHLASFLVKSRSFFNPSDSTEKPEGTFIHPTKILFNGGVTRPHRFQQRILDTVNQWLAADGKAPLQALVINNPDLAVSLGAAYYGRVCQGQGIRIKNATALSYYLGIESTLPAIPGIKPRVHGMCVVPVGLEEGSHYSISNISFGLIVGEPVSFRFFMARNRPADQIGNWVEEAEELLEELPVLQLQLSLEDSTKEGSPQIIPVTLRVHMSRLGSLEIWCDAIDGSQQWKLNLDLKTDKT